MIKNIIFDLGGVVLGRDFSHCVELLGENFSFLRDNVYPTYWEEFDRGVLTWEQVVQALSDDTNCSLEEADKQVTNVLNLLGEIKETKELIAELKTEGYKLYVLSNMPLEYYNHLCKFDVFKYFDGAVVSAIEKLIKPDPRIYGVILDRYNLEPSETLFIDDKKINTDMAASLGLHTVCFELENGIKNIKGILNANR